MSPVSDTSGDLDAPFRPIRGRVVPLVMGTLAVIICALVALGMGTIGTWGPGDQLALAGLGAMIAAFLFRYASIRAVPTSDGLVVRNLMLTRTLVWDEIMEVRFPDGDPWVSLELDDTDVVAVMAIQRVDAERGRAEAHRLADLVRRHQQRA